MLLLDFLGSSFLMLLYLLYNHCGFFLCWVSGRSLVVFLCCESWVSLFLLLFYLVFGFVFIWFEYTELLPGWLTSEACADQMLR